MTFNERHVPEMKGHSKSEAKTTESKLFKANVTLMFLAISITLSATFAFSVGCISRLLLISKFQNSHLTQSKTSHPNDGEYLTETDNVLEIGYVHERYGLEIRDSDTFKLPSPKLIPGKEVPETTYTSRVFSTAASATSNTLLLDRSPVKDIEEAGNESEKSILSTASNSSKRSNGDDMGWIPGSNYDPEEEPSTDKDDVHLPAGQHLLVDIKDVDGTFLNSEERLARAMIDLVDESKLTLLSYHCHSLIPNGVSCAGVLLESHVSFHTWPTEGVITLDLFTCGGNPLIPVLPSIEKMFAIPRASATQEQEKNAPKPSMLWAHKLRGFREGFSPDYDPALDPLGQDLGGVLGKLDFDMKKELVSTTTDFQRVDIYELIIPRFRDLSSYQKSLSGDGSYESTHPELYVPNRILFLDGVLQSTLYGDAPYHESIVHPAMLSHPDPKRVAIIGGGEGATLREVLKHKSVEKAVMIEIDEEIVDLSKEYLPEWSDCSDIVGSTDWCFDDSRAILKSLDAITWFTSNFGNQNVSHSNQEDLFDVIIMDALDPDIDVEFAVDLYQNENHIKSLYNALTEKGVLAVQLGEAPEGPDPADEVGRQLNRARMMKKLEQVGFKSLHIFEESHSEMTWPWSTLVAFKDYKTRASWYQSPAEVEVQLHKRIIPTHSGSSSLRYFDGSTMFGYQVPHKVYENIHCRKQDVPVECDEDRGFNPDTVNIPLSFIKVGMSKAGNHSGRGVFAVNDIPQNVAIARSEEVKAIHIGPFTWSVVEKMVNWAEIDKFYAAQDKIDPIITYFEGYGYASSALGMSHYHVDSGYFTFVNHGCNGTFNYGDNISITSEMDANVDVFPENMRTDIYGYDPVTERHLRQVMTSGDITLRDIKAGEEILSSYLDFVGDPQWWGEDVILLRRMCTGEGIGEITQYELDNDGYEDSLHMSGAHLEQTFHFDST